MEGPEDGHQPSPTTIFSQVLGPPADRQEVEESSARPRDRAVEVYSSNPEMGAGGSFYAGHHLFNESTNYRSRWQ